MRLAALFLTAVSLWAAPPQRIVSTAPSITETLFAMGLGPRVVGVTIYCKYPPAAEKIAKIGTFLKPDVEAILALHPDLVVVLKQENKVGAELARLHLPYVEMQSRNLQDVFDGARAIGKAAAASAGAERMIQNVDSQLRSIRAQVSGRPTPTVAFIVGHTPGKIEGLIAGAGKSYFADLLTAAGGIDIFADAITPYPKISLEEILSRNPDYILELSGEGKAKEDEAVALWNHWRSLKAVSGRHVVAIPPGPFLVPGPRAAEAAQTLLRILHPELRAEQRSHTP